MATLEEVAKKIQTKFKILDLAVKENKRIISRNKVNELVKKQKVFKKRLDEINNLKVATEGFMLEDDKSLGEVEDWVKLRNEAVSKYDIYLEEIETRLNYITKLEEESAMEQEERRMHRTMKEMQTQMREEFQMREEAKADNVNCKVKLPKLFITKFNGTHLDWFHFWNQFESDIEKSELSPVSKFSYLKELVSVTHRWALFSN